MRHRKSGLKLGKTASHRQSMFKNMVTSLFKHDRIRTTDVKAKELRRWADHVITLAKRGDLHARRQVLSIIRDKNLVHELFENAAEKYSQRSGGYTRIVKIGRRAGDAAPISLIELIDSDGSAKSKKRSSKTKAKPVPAPSVPSATDSPATTDDAKEKAVEEASSTTGATSKSADQVESETKSPEAEASAETAENAQEEDSKGSAQMGDSVSPENEKSPT